MPWYTPSRHALINGMQLRLVVTAEIVQRVLALNGLDRLIPVHPSRAAAAAAIGDRQTTSCSGGTDLVLAVGPPVLAAYMPKPSAHVKRM